MSKFSMELQRVIEGLGTQASFSEKCGINQGTLSGMSGPRPARIPRKHTLKRLLDTAGKNHAPGMLQAFLEDWIPNGYETSVEIQTRKGTAKRILDEPEYRLPRRLEAAFRGLRQKAFNSEHVAKAIDGFATALGIIEAQNEPELRRKGKKKTA